MKYSISDKQLREFQVEGLIAFSDFITGPLLDLIRSLPIGRDHWRSHPELEKFFRKKSFGEVISELTKESQIRLLMDRIIETGEVDPCQLSFQGTIIAAVFSIIDGSVTFYSVEKPFEITERGYLVIFGKATSRYVFSESDPETHLLKNKGYVFGDRLRVEDFPFIYH